MVPIKQIKPYERNPRKNKEAVKAVCKSIEKYGFKTIILLDANNVIIYGHTRWMAAKELGYDSVPCMYANDLTPEQVREYRIADNSTGEIAEWDLPLLKLELDELPGFDAAAMGVDLSWLNEVSPEEEPAEAVDDDYEPEPPEVPNAKLGQVYQLGRHRLMCGDSTKTEDVQKLCDGAKIDLLLTDPPYNVDYHGTAGTIQNDHFEDGEAFLQFLRDAFAAGSSVMKDGAVYYIWHADSEGENFRRAAREQLGKVRQTLIWKKSSLVLGRQDYQWIHEPCQPAGTIVWLPNGKRVPIEELNNGDTVVSFDTYSGAVKGYRDGYKIQTASRHYVGTLYGIHAGERITWATDNHQFSVIDENNILVMVRADDLRAGAFSVPVCETDENGTIRSEFELITEIETKPFDGTVYSLAVDKYKHYIADGIVTHNCLYGWQDGAPHYWGNDRKQTTVMEFDKPRSSKEHPTMKPIPLFDYQIRNSAAIGESVLDLFGGSGTTIMACEQNNRIGYVMEYDPRFVDVIIHRWETFTGQTAKLIQDAD